MELVQHILGFPETIAGGVIVYPIRVKDFDAFIRVSDILSISSASLGVGEEVSVFDVLVYHASKDVQMLEGLYSLFSLTMRYADVQADGAGDSPIFIVGKNMAITRNNYTAYRQAVMRQNLIFEKPKFANKIVEQWADRVLESRHKNGVKHTIEDIITTVSVYTGKPYHILAEQTLYQVYADFKRISKIKEYDVAIEFKCAGADKVVLKHFSEQLNMFANPYEGLFVGASSLSTSQVLPIGEE